MKRFGEKGMVWAVVWAIVAMVVGLSAGAASAATVSLGDSYSSGEGAGPFSRSTQLEVGNGCHRSANAWPRLLGVPEANHFACSGATTEDFFAAQKRGLLAAPDNTSQLDRLRALAARESISTVYVTIGGNDLGFARIIRDCVTHECLKQMDKKELTELHGEVKPAVVRALQETRVAAAGGQVILVGYPNLIPGHGSRFGNCGWLTDKEKPRVWRLEDGLDTALSEAASSAGVSYVPVRDALKGHELCTKDSWVFPVASAGGALSLRGPANPQQGHPNADGQRAIADVVRSAQDVGAGAVPPPPPGCVPATNVAAIVDDSGSMSGNDPLNIRGAAMQLLITKPGGQGRTLGGVEFGGDAGPLFDPSPISANQAGMLSALSGLDDDGYTDGGNTDYNDAFEVSGIEQPSPSARIFLTDGGHNVGPYENGHLGGARTYVIGLNIGPAGEGSPEADLLGKIAGDTGGFYFPLRRAAADSPETQSQRLQPVFNAIDALLQCRGVPQQAARTLVKPNVPARPVTGQFAGVAGLEVVLSWTTPNTQVGLAGATVRNAAGAVVANLTGKRPPRQARRRGKKPPKPAVLRPGVVQGATFETVTVARPPRGSSLTIAVSAAALAAPTAVSIQIAPLQSLPPGTLPAAPVGSTGSAGQPSPPPPAGGGSPPPPPANHIEQETPNHPVNTFTNYHNASGVGPQIAAGQWVEVSCRVHDPTIASVNPDGYWYRIASAPWNNSYYAPANTFMNGDPYGGPYTHNTDFAVPVC